MHFINEEPSTIIIVFAFAWAIHLNLMPIGTEFYVVITAMCTFRLLVALFVSQTHDINFAFILGPIAWDSAHFAGYLSIILTTTRAALACEFNNVAIL